MDERTEAELAEVAESRAAAIGKPVAVVAFTSSERMRVFDLEPSEGQLEPLDQGEFPLLNPSDPEVA
jgi:hypothetical protein